MMKRTTMVAVGLATILLLGGCASSAQENGTQAVEQELSEGPISRDEGCLAIADAERTVYDRVMDENPALRTINDDEMTMDERTFTTGLTREWGESLATIERKAPQELAVELRNVAPLVTSLASADEATTPEMSAGMMQDGLDSMKRINSMCGAEELFDGDPET